MIDRNVLKERIQQSVEHSPEVWAIIEGYLDGEYTKSNMYDKLISFYGDLQNWNKQCAIILISKGSQLKKDKLKII